MDLPVIYAPKSDISLRKFGILIPLLDHRAKQCVDTLSKFGLKVLKLSKKRPLFTPDDLALVHQKQMIENLFNPKTTSRELIKTYELIDSNGKFNRYDPSQTSMPLEQLFRNILAHASFTYYSISKALDHGWSYYLGGGMHHAHFATGSGFCQIHDGLISLRKLQKEKKIKRAWIIDLDAHKGDATAALTKNDSSVLTLSIHMKNSWPTNQKKRNLLTPWWIKSDVDIEMAKKEEDKYLDKLSKGLEKLEKIAKNIGPPDVVWIIDGADPFAQDQLPSTLPLQLSQFQMLARSAYVATFFYQRQIPQAWVIGGGYGEEVYKIHAQSILFLNALYS